MVRSSKTVTSWSGKDTPGRSKSEGIFLLNRPLNGPLIFTGIDEDTDAYDTIEWLTKNVPESNKRVRPMMSCCTSLAPS